MITIILVFISLNSRRHPRDDKGNIYQTNELTEAAISAATRSDDGNLLVTLMVSQAA
jgi:hypothetical protein